MSDGLGRGPDEREIALGRCARAKLALLDLQDALDKALAEDRAADEVAGKLGITPPGVPLNRSMQAAVDVQRGVAFWDRPPLEPTPR